MSTTHRERELTFDVPDSWTLPDAAELLPKGGRVERETQRLETTYYDTVSRDLLGAGLTLRRRRGDADEGWQLKVPAGDARLEIHNGSAGRTVPAELRALTNGARGRAALQTLATLRTERRVQRLLAADGTRLAEIVHDDVIASTQARMAVTRTWHEVEVELLEGGTEALLATVAAWLRKQGAVEAPQASKLARAVDARAPRRDPARLSGVLGRYLDTQFAAIMAGDVALRRGEQPIHDTRVATRRYRSILRVFGAVLDPVWARRLDEELRWYAAVLGEVRDRHVLRAHLRSALPALPAGVDGAAAGAYLSHVLDEEEAAAVAALTAALDSARYHRLVALLRDWRAELPLVEDAPARAVERYLRRARRTVRRRRQAAERAPAAERDEATHRARKAAKRARYAAEASRPVLGGTARTAARKAKKVQRRLGERQDNVLAAQFLQRVGARAGGDAFVCGVLYERERRRTARS